MVDETSEKAAVCVHNCEVEKRFLNKRCGLLGHRAVVEVDLAASWVMGDTSEVVKVILVMVQPLDEEEAMMG